MNNIPTDYTRLIAIAWNCENEAKVDDNIIK